MSNGKGDAPRPLSVRLSEYERRWLDTFKREPLTPAERTGLANTLGVLDELVTTPQIASHEPDPSGGK